MCLVEIYTFLFSCMMEIRNIGSGIWCLYLYQHHTLIVSFSQLLVWFMLNFIIHSGVSFTKIRWNLSDVILNANLCANDFWVCLTLD
jgi:hypothetical protein